MYKESYESILSRSQKRDERRGKMLAESCMSGAIFL